MENSLTEKKELKILARRKIRIAEIIFLEQNLLTFKFNNDITVTVDDIREMAEVTREITGGEVPLRSLVITGQRNNISTEAFAYNPYEELKIKQKSIAEAVVIKNLPTRIMANFYYKVAPRSFPVKMFENKEDAMEWLFSKKIE